MGFHCCALPIWCKLPTMRAGDKSRTVLISRAENSRDRGGFEEIVTGLIRIHRNCSASEAAPAGRSLHLTARRTAFHGASRNFPPPAPQSLTKMGETHADLPPSPW